MATVAAIALPRIAELLSLTIRGLQAQLAAQDVVISYGLVSAFVHVRRLLRTADLLA